MTYRFVGNIYNPDGPDAMTKLLSENYGTRSTRRKVGLVDQVDDDGLVIAGKISLPPSLEYVLHYIKNVWLSDKKIGQPRPPKTSELSQEDLINMGYIGIFEKIQPDNRFGAPSTGTGTGESTYPKHARYGENGKVIEIIKQEHTL